MPLPSKYPLRTALLALAFGAISLPALGAGTYNPPKKEAKPPKPPEKPAVSAPSPIHDDHAGHDHGEDDSLGGPIAAPQIKANAQTTRPNGVDNAPPPGTPFVPGVTYAGATETGSGDPLQPPKALGPPPFDLGRVARVRIGQQTLAEAPMRVGNLDILTPLVEEAAPLGISITQCNPKNAPVLLGVAPGDFFQINQSGQSPTVLAVGKATAWQKQSDGTFLETALRSAPLVINGQLYLPALSLAQIVGAAPRLSPDGTLLLSPTIQSVEVFPVGDTVAITIKSSAPVPEGAATIKSMPASGKNAPRVYVDFEGFSMGFDAGNSTSVRLVANGVGDVLGARAGQPSGVPSDEVTRVTLDLKKPLVAVSQKIPDEPTIFALIVMEGGQKPPPIPDPDPVPIPNPGPNPPYPGPASDQRRVLQGARIVIDAGHGGDDSGARGSRSYEKQHTLDIAKRLAQQLRARGATVMMTRESDWYPTLQGRVAFANSRRAHLFISIHMNASVNKSSGGTETFYYTGQSLPLARSVHPELIKATGLLNRGISQARFFVIRNTFMPSLLLECAFVSNPTEEKIALDTKWRDRLAIGVTRGVVKWWETYGPGGLRG